MGIYPTAEILHLGADILNHIILHGDCSVYSRILSSAVLMPIENSFLVVTIKMSSDIAKCLLGAKITSG